MRRRQVVARLRACSARRAATATPSIITRVPRLFADLELAHGDGRFARLFRKIARVDLLILDDWGPSA